MRTFLFSAIVLLSLNAVSVRASYGDRDPGYIRSAEFMDDFDTLVITLSEGMPDSYVEVLYAMQDVGAAEGGFQTRADGQTTLKIHDFRRYVIFEGSTGKGQVTLRYCVEHKDDTNSITCTWPKTLAIDTAADVDFEDVSSNHPNFDAIVYALKNGIASGYPDGTFLPESSTNRAEFTKLVTLYTFGQQMVDMCKTRLRFSDVPDAWYVKYICRAQDAHLIRGYPDGSFRPADTINFAEAAKILVLADDFNAGEVRQQESNPWYERYVRYLAERNAIPTTVRSLRQPITRGETVEIIYRLKTGNNDKPSKAYEDLAR